MINIKGFYTAQTTKKSSNKISQFSLANNEITPFTWYEVLCNFSSLNSGPPILHEGPEGPFRPNSLARTEEFIPQLPQYNSPSPMRPKPSEMMPKPSEMMPGRLRSPLGYYNSQLNHFTNRDHFADYYVNRYDGIIISENTETYEDFKNFIESEDNAKLGVNYFQNYLKLKNDHPEGTSILESLPIIDVEENLEVIASENITYINDDFGRRIDDHARIIKNNNLFLKTQPLKDMLDSTPEEVKESSSYKDLLNFYNSFDANVIPVLISFHYQISDDEEYNISTIASFDENFRNFNDLNFIKSYSKLETPIIKKSDEILTIMYNQVISFPAESTTQFTIDSDVYNITCKPNLAEIYYLKKTFSMPGAPVVHGGDKEFPGVFSILEKLLNFTPFIIYDVPGIGLNFEFTMFDDGSTLAPNYQNLNYNDYGDNNSLIFGDKNYTVSVRDNLLKINLSSLVNYNFYLAAEYGIKAINYGFFILEFDNPIKTKNPKTQEELNNFKQTGEIQFATFNDDSLNNAEEDDETTGRPKMIKSPGISFNIPMTFKVSDIMKFDELILSYANSNSLPPINTGPGYPYPEDMPR